MPPTPEPPLIVATRRSGEAAEIFCIGAIDISTVGTFRDAVDEAAASGCDTLIIDFALTEFMDSTGLAALAHATKRVANVGVRHVDDAIRRMLVLSGISAVVDVMGED